MDEVFRKRKLEDSYSVANARSRPQSNSVNDVSTASHDRMAASSTHHGQSGENVGVATIFAQQAPFVARNSKGERVDLWFRARRCESLDARRARGKSTTPCNDHFLGTGCHKQGCGFDHGTCNQEELQALRWLARQSPCIHLNDCSNSACYYGHQCPFDDCRYGSGCRFFKVHGKSTVPVTSERC